MINKKHILALFMMILPAYSFTMLPHQQAFVRALPKAVLSGGVLGGYLAHKDKEKNRKVFEMFAQQDADRFISVDTQEKPSPDSNGLTEEEKRNLKRLLTFTIFSWVLWCIADSR